MLAVWISFIGNLAEYTGFTNPDDYEWQKRLEEYREQYENTLLTKQPEVIQTAIDNSSPLKAVIKEVEGWYTEIKENGNLHDKQVYERFNTYGCFMQELIELSMCSNPNDYDWQKRLDDYRDEYESIL